MSQENNENNKKTITIRGVDEKIYRKLTEIARSSGKTIGEVTNQAFKTFLDISDAAKRTASGVVESGKTFIEGFKEGMGNLIIISDIDELSVNKEEIMQTSKPIAFKGIKKLSLVGISDDDIEKYIQEISDVDELIIPSSVNKLKLLQKCRRVKRVVVQNNPV
ncbi:hypothetical protein SULI_13530 [Saccharolobus solfataricus]|uniref:Uncharacterized protein n=3 Tax=Saccharolobus solfataricus TaxID=2287 RepID=Q97XA8_SACS2|nr:hypothetical protein [Saccharolobus solfataricus]AAK42034.1 Conserved hypothetical protein [Saccharolobus solfataricus P2]AKA74747.1 hypothetical protein SULB_2658 [Saccharolobus solfataricus]AKA77443.1 hypothetical protein SULC_2655 [Saccharolobus solfataricus]AKA80133.1 hypothetical protein SULA_2657 [Saccharolobus solfataricus]AZF69214.1 hypothetical protein SULG_13530 [Saccharolobus solfataricus]